MEQHIYALQESGTEKVNNTIVKSKSEVIL
jgi:hypothetical protein